MLSYCYMLRSFPLHRADRKADWETVPEHKRNLCQKLAAASNGWLTPGNLISVAGGVLTIAGLLQLRDELASGGGLLLIAVGRFADVADGYIAAKTGTKSPLGSWLDPAIDKILSVIAVILLWTAALVPPIVLLAIAIQSIFNSIIGIGVARRGLRMHISKEGKLAMAAIWICILLFLLYKFWQFDAEEASGVALMSAYTVFGAFLILGFRSSRKYYLGYKSARNTSKKL